MSQCKQTTFGPVALSATLTTNILSPPTTTGGAGAGTPSLFIKIYNARVVNKTAGAVTCSFWLGATGANAAGTEVWANGLSVPANSYIDFPYPLVIESGSFLVGGASAGTSLTLEGLYEIGVR